ncbi:nucleolin-like isoform X2 [Pistacia vera]|uniref:nucleolin-like isoform X2 n=1 Tax=Pistacia vera TaxID=55513 RepID=UPI00126357E1|nr:nucleolin-like isoform X2 [Pistacia vera]
MRTRNADSAKSTATKKTPPVRKAAAKVSPTSSESVTPKIVETTRGSAGKAKQAKANDTAPPQHATGSDSKSDQSAVEEVKAFAEAATMTPVKKATVPGARPGAKKKLVKTKTRASEKAVKARVEESLNEEFTVENVGEPIKQKENIVEAEEPAVANVTESTKEEGTAAEDDGESVKEVKTSVEEDAIKHVGDSVKKKEPLVREIAKFNENKELSCYNNEEQGDFVKQKDPVILGFAKSNDNKEASFQKYLKDVEEDDEMETFDDEEEPKIELMDTKENMKAELLGEDAEPEQDEYGSFEIFEDYGDQVDYGDHEEEEFAEDDIEEPTAETDTLEDEHRELKAIARDRRIKKEHEIFVGGLDRDATEEDVRKVFERIGDIAEVRLHKNFATNRNKGYAFVKFANKEHAQRALSEMKNPVICGKRCGTAPSEDNDTLFVGNICNTWTKEAIKQKLKDYGVEGVESITLVPDAQHEGLSRGFAFVEFSCHVDAMAAYKRLQKPDVVFGHPERTVKVAFAEPLREPDPVIMAQVKTVFLDGVPPHWNEDQVEEQIQGFGEIVRIVLARNMSTAKRKDYGFVDFSTHEAAVACIKGVNNKEVVDGNSKVKLKARLSNPMPKTQAVKGGMCGGYRIGHGGSGTFSRYERGFGRGGHHFNSANFQRGRGFYQRGRGQIGRIGPNDYGLDNRYTEFHGRQFMGRGGRRGSFRGGHHTSGRSMAAAGPSRPNPSRRWLDVPDRGHGDHFSYRRQPFSPDEDFDRRYVERQVDDPYYYDDRAHGVKRPFYAVDHDPDYMVSSRVRPRLDYNDPAVSLHGSRYRDDYGAGSGLYSDDYYVSDYGAYPPYYGDDRSYGGGYYY